MPKQLNLKMKRYCYCYVRPKKTLQKLKRAVIL